MPRAAPRPVAAAHSRPPHRHPAYGGQARREAGYAPYVLGFLVILGALAAFLYVGLNWATGPGRIAGTASPAPSPTVPAEERTYVVKAGDTPSGIARQFHVTAEELLAANGISDPRRLQVGQTLKIPPGH